MAQGMKQFNQQLQDELVELQRIVQAFRDGQYNEVEGAKMLVTEQINSLKVQRDEQDDQIQSLKRANQHLRQELPQKAHF